MLTISHVSQSHDVELSEVYGHAGRLSDNG